MRIEHTAIWVSDLERMKAFMKCTFMAKPILFIIMRRKILSRIL